MSAQVEYFCSDEEESEIIRYLTRGDDVHVFDVSTGSMIHLPEFSPENLPAFPEPLSIYIWLPLNGSLVWHTATPEVGGDTRSSFVRSVFARETWDKANVSPGGRMLDTNLSPVVHFKRGEYRNGKTGPWLVLAPATSLSRVGVEYERYIRRILAWIRRRGRIVHDCRKHSDSLPNPMSFMNTLYAFPDALKLLENGTHDYVASFGCGT